MTLPPVIRRNKAEIIGLITAGLVVWFVMWFVGWLGDETRPEAYDPPAVVEPAD